MKLIVYIKHMQLWAVQLNMGHKEKCTVIGLKSFYKKKIMKANKI